MAGNFTKQELTLTGAALNTWQLDTDEVDVQDQLRLYALFGRFSHVGSPPQAAFDGVTNLITTSAGQAGQAQANEAGDTGHKYELPTTGEAEYASGGHGDARPRNARRQREHLRHTQRDHFPQAQ